MLTQAELLEAARRAQGDATTYRLGKLLGVTNAYIYHLAAGEALASPALALKLAELAKLEPGYVLACIEAERAARSGTSEGATLARHWRKVAERVRGAAAAVAVATLAALISSFSPESSARPSLTYQVDDLYIMRSSLRRTMGERRTRRRRLWERWRTVFPALVRSFAPLRASPIERCA
jgi:hypothetical protein